MDLIESLKRSSQLVVGGHRGQILEGVRENTLAAFDTVLGKGIPYVEVDVQLTKDGILVLYHDHDLSQKTSITGMVRDYTLAQLQASFDLCTVAEAIDWAKIHDMGLAFELKLRYPEMAEDRLPLGQELVELIQQKNFTRQCFVFGKDLDLLRLMKAQEPALPLGVICQERPEQPAQFMADLGADIYLNFLSDLTPALVADLQEAGYLVDGSVVNSRADLELALDLGVNLIESDYPETILNLLEESHETSC